MEMYLRKFIPNLNPKVKYLVHQIYKAYSFIRYFYYFDKFLPFRNVYICVGKDLSMLPQIKLNIYEKTELDLLENILTKANSIFWDIGANVGLYSVIFSKLNPTWKIYSFEPNFGVHKNFHKNVRRNNCSNIELLTFALSNSKGVSNLRLNYYRPGTNKIDDKLRRFKRSMLINSFSGDELYSSGKLPAPNFIKIDVEGSELKVLQGLENLISKFMPTISIEVAPSVWKDKIEFSTYLKKLNQLLQIYRTGILITNGVKQEIISFNDIILDDSIQTLILVKPSKDKEKILI